MNKKQTPISDKIALSNLEALLRIPLIKRRGLIGISSIMAKRPVKFKPQKGNVFYSPDIPGVKTDIIERESSHHQRIVLYFHSGGFYSSSTDTHREIGEMFLKYSSADTVAVCDYSTAPDFKFPAAHNDAFNLLKHFRSEPEFCHSKVITAGDSSGGNLALACAVMAKEREVLPPDGCVLMSPWLDFTRSGKSYHDNFNSDPMFGYMCTPRDKELLTLYADGCDKSDPVLSPVFADLSGLSPILIQTCNNEMLLDDAKLLKEKADKFGVDATLKIYDGMFHSFQTISPNAATSKSAWSDAGAFIDKIFN